ncbi:YjcZ family sporulation protein [Rossellomorea aquimaris]|nr:YjcZ family sporulation protein [Rossellomorea aquimaris]MCA1054536.1 YjcZ family sporulation protein [Rossellomorea aquimaris]
MYPGYGYPVAGVGCGNSFALIVVLFILLIIIGAVCYCGR